MRARAPAPLAERASLRGVKTIAIATSLLVTFSALADVKKSPSLPSGYWPAAKSAPILAKTATVRLAPDLSALSEAEKTAVQELLAAGEVMQELYELSRHAQAPEAEAKLLALHEQLGRPEATSNLLELYRLNQGPIASTLENDRLPFLPVDPQPPGKNVYPWGVTKGEIDAFVAANPASRAEILGERTVVRRATKESIAADLATLDRYPALSLLHPKQKPQLLALAAAPSASGFYAVPYSIAYAGQMTKAYRHLNVAADAIESEDAQFARYLRNRGRDLLSNDYESGDASWVTGKFGKLNAQIGAYETYDDALYGVKAFHSLSLLLNDEKETAELRRAIGGLQAIEDSLPYEPHKRVREEISVGIYDVIADFGQARGTNTATILPNDTLFTRRYGRTILLRRNIMKNPDIFANAKAGWDAVVAGPFEADLEPEGDFFRTLWHEIGHYLGPDQARDGRDLGVALEEHNDALEEMKSDLVSLFAVPALEKSKYYDSGAVRAVYAAGIRRTLQNVRPRPDQPYQTMQLAQFNYFLGNGLLSWDAKKKKLSIDYSKYPEVVAALLREVMAIQQSGDKAAAGKFFEKHTTWTPELHDAVAAKLRDAQKARWRLVRYAALGE